MARISPTPGSPISFGDILDKMGLSRSNRSFDATEVTAMGGSTSSNMTAANSICMPYQAQATASLGNGGVGAPNANWTSTAATNWRPVRMSEFRDGYNNKPQITGSSAGVFTPNNTDNTRCTLTVNGTNSDAYTGAGTPYYFRVTGSGTFTGQNVWTIANANAGRQRVYSVTGLNTIATDNWVARVQDFEGCGNDGLISTPISY